MLCAVAFLQAQRAIGLDWRACLGYPYGGERAAASTGASGRGHCEGMGVSLLSQRARRDSAGEVLAAARRAVLCALILSGSAWVLAMSLTRSAGTKLWLAAWALFAWSVVVSAYAAVTYWRNRRLTAEASTDQSMVDPLTGLPNRQALMAELELLDTASQEMGRRVRLIDVDLVNLNKVNYEFGQMVGDAVLQDIAELLRKLVPESALVGRLGGDEFLIIAPQASTGDANALAREIEQAVADYRLNLGEQGTVDSIKANVSVAPYLPDKASLHEAVAIAKGATAQGRLAKAAAEPAQQGFCHVPRVTLGAFAVYRWSGLSDSDQQEFKLWQNYLDASITERMVQDLLRLLEEKAEVNWLDFVTCVPSPGVGGADRVYPARRLAEALAEKLKVPFREVMRGERTGPDSRTVEPVVDSALRKGEGVLLVSDAISSGILERKCVKKLSAAGAHVTCIAWTAY